MYTKGWVLNDPSILVGQSNLFDLCIYYFIIRLYVTIFFRYGIMDDVFKIRKYLALEMVHPLPLSQPVYLNM